MNAENVLPMRFSAGRIRVAVGLSLPLPLWVEVFSGIRSLISERGLPWDLLPLTGGFETALREWCAEGRIDGLIGTWISGTWLAGLGACRPATVHIAWWADLLEVPTVRPDFEAMGSLAAAHLLDQKAHDLAFLGLPGMAMSSGIERGFRRVAAERGVRVISMKGRSPGIWREELLGLSSGFGLCAVDDELARSAVRVLRDAGRRIPQDAAVIGCGSFPSESIRAGIGLSSPRWEMGEVGRAAARVLAGELGGEATLPGNPVSVGLAPFVPGESSLRLRESDPLIAGCIGFMREHYDEIIAVGDLARRAGMSRRKFEIAFRAFAGCSPYRHLQELRLEAAARMLKETGEPMLRISQRCGFGTQHLFSSAFRKWAGVSPTRYRAAHESPR